MTLSTFRVDITDVDLLKQYLSDYQKVHPTAKYCINSEISDKKHKHHFQGWIDVPTELKIKNVRDFFAKRFRPHVNECSQASAFATVEKPDNYRAYILNNEMKPDTSYTTVITNYTEEEFLLYKTTKVFVKLPDIPKGRKSVTKTYQDKVLTILEEHCVVDGKIKYTKIPHKYLEIAPQLAMDKPVARKNATGYTLRLENLYPDKDNTLITDYLYDGIVFDETGKPTPFNHFYQKPDFNPDYNCHIQK